MNNGLALLWYFEIYVNPLFFSTCLLIWTETTLEGI